MITEEKMNKELKEFSNEKFGTIRGIEINGEPWLVGKDIAKNLGYKDTVNALKNHVDEEDKKRWQITTPSRGKQTAVVINESGFYSLLLRSNLPTAKRFKHWVTCEVLPSIRKNGTYISRPILDQIQENPEILFKIMEQALKDRAEKEHLEKQTKILENQVRVLEPKAKMCDIAMTSKTTLSFAQVAAILDLKFGNVTLVKILRNSGVLKADNTPMREYIDRGYFTVKEKTIKTSDGVKIIKSTRVYQKGLLWLSTKFR